MGEAAKQQEREKLVDEMTREEKKAYYDDKPINEWERPDDFQHAREEVDGNHPYAAGMRTEGADVPDADQGGTTTERAPAGEKIIRAGTSPYSTGSNEPVPEPGADEGEGGEAEEDQE